MANPVFCIAVRPRLLHSLKGGKGLGVPRLGPPWVNGLANTVRKHPAQVEHGKRVAGLSFRQHERIGFIGIWRCVPLAMQKRPGFFVTSAPYYAGRHFKYGFVGICFRRLIFWRRRIW